jgi:hypothetical protein
MTEREYDVKAAELYLKHKELDARAAKVQMEERIKQIQAKASHQIDDLKNMYQSTLLDVEEAKLNLRAAVEKEESFQ